MTGWLSDEEWEWARARMPVICVDLVPLTASHVGLILRNTPAGDAWCLVGGRIRRGEAIGEAAMRHLHETLGSRADIEPVSWASPDVVAQYFTEERPGHPVDPRQHSIALTYRVALHGDVVASGEAMSFAWFPWDALPSPIGFGQENVLASLLAAP